MTTISTTISKKEHDAIVEYANACGETVSNLVRKSMVRHITLMDGFHDSNEYEVVISIPDNATGEEETSIVQNTINKCRRILGLNEVEI